MNDWQLREEFKKAEIMNLISGLLLDHDKELEEIVHSSVWTLDKPRHYSEIYLDFKDDTAYSIKIKKVKKIEE